MKDQTLTVEFDGGSRNNPGHAGAGVVVRADDGTPLVKLGKYVGIATNNVAEYHGLIHGLQEAKTLGAGNVVVRGDSQLVIKQMKGEYKVKHPGLKPLHDRARALAAEFASVTYEHNLRHKNEDADRMANLAMDKKADVRD